MKEKIEAQNEKIINLQKDNRILRTILCNVKERVDEYDLNANNKITLFCNFCKKSNFEVEKKMKLCQGCMVTSLFLKFKQN